MTKRRRHKRRSWLFDIDALVKMELEIAPTTPLRDAPLDGICRPGKTRGDAMAKGPPSRAARSCVAKHKAGDDTERKGGFLDRSPTKFMVSSQSASVVVVSSPSSVNR